MSDRLSRHTRRAGLLYLPQVLSSLFGAEEIPVHRHNLRRGFHLCINAFSDFTKNGRVDEGGLHDRDRAPKQSQLSSKPITNPFHRQLTGAVGCASGQDNESGDGREVDDAALVGAEGGEEALGQVEGAVDVDIEHASKRGERVEFKGEFLGDPCVVHQADERDILRSELGEDLLGAGLDGGGAGHVHDDGSEVLEAKGFQGRGIGRFTHGAVDDVTLFRQVLRGVIPDPSAGASDDDGAALGGDGEAFAEGQEDDLVEEEGEDDGGDHAHADALEELGRRRFWCHGFGVLCAFVFVCRV